MRQVFAAQILALGVFQILPDAFLRIDLRRIGRQPFQMKTTRLALREIGFECFAAMDRGPGPQQQHLAGNLPFEVCQEINDTRAVKGLFAQTKEYPSFGSDRTDHRSMLMAKFAFEKRRIFSANQQENSPEVEGVKRLPAELILTF